jgi:hypothetical protein
VNSTGHRSPPPRSAPPQHAGAEQPLRVDWEADDPRLPAVRDRLVVLIEAADAEGWENPDAEISDELAELLDSVFLDLVPIAHRLMELLEERGWRGWTKLDAGERRVLAMTALSRADPFARGQVPPSPSPCSQLCEILGIRKVCCEPALADRSTFSQ